MGMELTGDALHLGPLLGHAAHLARERMDARLSRYDMTPGADAYAAVSLRPRRLRAPAGCGVASAGKALHGQWDPGSHGGEGADPPGGG